MKECLMVDNAQFSLNINHHSTKQTTLLESTYNNSNSNYYIYSNADTLMIVDS